LECEQGLVSDFEETGCDEELVAGWELEGGLRVGGAVDGFDRIDRGLAEANAVVSSGADTLAVGRFRVVAGCVASAGDGAAGVDLGDEGGHGGRLSGFFFAGTWARRVVGAWVFDEGNDGLEE
jgi:hypothetical protein